MSDDPVKNPVYYVDDEPGSRPQKRVLITALGPLLPNREEQLRGVSAAILQGGQQPVLVATHLSTRFLVTETQPTELMPLRRDLAVLTEAEYRSYVQRRWLLLLAKWQITDAIDLGQTFEEFLAGQSEEAES